MAKIVSAKTVERCRKLRTLRKEIETRQAACLAKLESLRGKLPVVLAGVALEEIDQSDAVQLRAEVRRLLEERAALEIISNGLDAWENPVQRVN